MTTELFVSMPIKNPDTTGVSRSFRYCGVLDVHENQEVIDWKALGRPERFIKASRIGCQGERYVLALMHDGHAIKKIEYRLLTKPSIMYCKPVYRFAVLKEGNKNAVKVCESIHEAEVFMKERQGKKQTEAHLYSIQRRSTGDTSRDNFEERCVEWLKDPEKARIIPHDHWIVPAKLKQAEWSLWDTVKRILENRNRESWQTRTSACFAYERECTFMPLCDCLQNGGDVTGMKAELYERTVANPELANRQHDPDKNSEVMLALPVLTHSMVQDFELCEMYFYWKHEEHLQRTVDEQEKDALWTGSAVHIGVDVNAKQGLDAALEAINLWAERNPVIGLDQSWKQHQEIAKARAMVRVAAERWPRKMSSLAIDREDVEKR
jgi:hypothetical protein